MFENITSAPADPILGLGELYLQDPRAHKINLGIGVYKDEKGKTPVLDSVKKAETFLLEHEMTKNYLSIEGLPAFATVTQQLLFGDASPIIKEHRAKTAQTPGGTGALRIAAEFLVKKTNAKRIWISNPSWPNHQSVFSAAGLEIKSYAYYDAANHSLDFDGMIESLKDAQAGDVVLFHGCCHNPTGIDPTAEQWQILANLSAERGWLPLFDFAYQGFAVNCEEDARGLRIFTQNHSEMLIASSYSKNFGLYNERVGAFTLIAANAETANRAFSQVKTVIRVIYSNPPAHGGLIVSTILSTPDLKEEWQTELTEMRQRIQRMRQLFVKTLQDKGAAQDFSFITQQNGMFSFSGLTAEQVQRLRDDFAIYAVSSGRINVAGMTLDNMSTLCESMIKVL